MPGRNGERLSVDMLLSFVIGSNYLKDEGCTSESFILFVDYLVYLDFTQALFIHAGYFLCCRSIRSINGKTYLVAVGRVTIRRFCFREIIAAPIKTGNVYFAVLICSEVFSYQCSVIQIKVKYRTFKQYLIAVIGIFVCFNQLYGTKLFFISDVNDLSDFGSRCINGEIELFRIQQVTVGSLIFLEVIVTPSKVAHFRCFAKLISEKTVLYQFVVSVIHGENRAL